MLRGPVEGVPCLQAGLGCAFLRLQHLLGQQHRVHGVFQVFGDGTRPASSLDLPLGFEQAPLLLDLLGDITHDGQAGRSIRMFDPPDPGIHGTQGARGMEDIQAEDLTGGSPLQPTEVFLREQEADAHPGFEVEGGRAQKLGHARVQSVDLPRRSPGDHAVGDRIHEGSGKSGQKVAAVPLVDRQASGHPEREGDDQRDPREQGKPSRILLARLDGQRQHVLVVASQGLDASQDGLVHMIEMGLGCQGVKLVRRLSRPVRQAGDFGGMHSHRLDLGQVPGDGPVRRSQVPIGFTVGVPAKFQPGFSQTVQRGLERGDIRLQMVGVRQPRGLFMHFLDDPEVSRGFQSPCAAVGEGKGRVPGGLDQQQRPDQKPEEGRGYGSQNPQPPGWRDDRMQWSHGAPPMGLV